MCHGRDHPVFSATVYLFFLLSKQRLRLLQDDAGVWLHDATRA